MFNRGFHFRSHLMAACLIAATSTAALAQGTDVVFVDALAPDGGDGLSWETAFNSLLDIFPVTDIGTEVWVKQGIYHPASTGIDPRSNSITLKCGAVYLGGFAGFETNADQRDPVNNLTVLSGDIGVPGDPTDNSYRVVKLNSCGSKPATTLDGFIIEGGNANASTDRGAGIFANSDLVLVDCIIRNNYASYRAAGVHADDSFTATGCVFLNNTGPSEGGVAIYHNSGNTTIVDCQFEGNSGAGFGVVQAGNVYIADSHFSDNEPGAVWITGFGSLGVIKRSTFLDQPWAIRGGGSSIVVEDCTFSGHYHSAVDASPEVLHINNCDFRGNNGANGGAIHSWSLDVHLTNCLLSGNTATNGGGVYLPETSVITNCTFSANDASSSGGAIHGGDVTVANSILWGNTAGGDSDLQDQIHATASTFTYSCIQGLGPADGDGNVGIDPAFVNALGPDLIAGTDDDDLRLQPGSICIDSGDNASVPPDLTDMNGNGDMSEPIPFDLAGNDRFFDDPDTPDQGLGEPPIIDRGCFEFDGSEVSIGPGTFVGPKGGSWFQADNWFGGGIPDSRTNVVIPGHVVVDQEGAVAATIVVEDGGVLDVVAGGSIEADALTVNDGGIFWLMPDSAIQVVNMTIQNGAALHWIGGTIAISGSLVTTDELLVGCTEECLLNIQNAVVQAPHVLICAAGTVEGTGFFAGSVTSAGLLAPGAPVGEIVVASDFEQTSTGQLAVTLHGYESGIDASLISIGGSSQFQGALSVLTSSEFVPELGERVQVIDAQQASLFFEQINWPDLANEFVLLFEPSEVGASLATSLSSTGSRLYVDAAARAGGNGQTWEAAIGSVEGALYVATTSNDLVSEVWVAQGLYHPSRRTDPADARSVTFTLVDGVALYGGFVGTEQDLEERDPVANATILSGDLFGNDVPGTSPFEPTLSDNAYHVLTSLGVGSTTRVDGFVVANGNATAEGAEVSDERHRGGGLLNIGGELVVANCMFLDNRAHQRGGAIFNMEGDLFVTGCHFEANAAVGVTSGVSAARGGAVCNEGAAPTYELCSFEDNRVLNFGEGLAMFSSASTVNVLECSFREHIGGNGRRGTVVHTDGSGGSFVSCVFENNHADSASGIHVIASSPLIDDCVFDGNTAGNLGGSALFLNNSASAVQSCTFINNITGLNFGSPRGGAVRVLGDNDPGPHFTDCLFQGNFAYGEGGALVVGGSSAAQFTACTMIGNSTALSGGAVYLYQFAKPLFQASEFIGNVAPERGGAFYQFSKGSATFTDCVFADNSASDGSSIYNHRGLIAGNADVNGGLFNAATLILGSAAPSANFETVFVEGSFQHLQLLEQFADLATIWVKIGGYTVGEEHDHIQVLGDVQLDGGSLVISFVDGFVPAIGDSFNLVVGDTIIGEFNSVNFTGLPSDLGLEVSYVGGNVKAVVVESVPPRFTPWLTISPEKEPIAAHSAELDGDGFPELALAFKGDGTNQPGQLHIHKNLGLDELGEWLGYAAEPFVVDDLGHEPSSITSGHLNDDQFPDLLIVNSTSNTISTVINLGGSYFLHLQEHSTGEGLASNVQATDLTADGLAEVAVSDEEAGVIRLFSANENGGLNIVTDLASVTTPTAIEFRDLNGTGLHDLIVCNSRPFPGQSTVSIHEGLGGLEFEPAIHYETERLPVAMAIASYDSDAFLDIVVANNMDDSISVFQNNPLKPGIMQRVSNIPVGQAPMSLAALDADQDGRMDIALARFHFGPTTGALHIVRNETSNGKAISFSVSEPLSLDLQFPHTLLASDVNGDGIDDLIVLGYSFNSQVKGQVLLNLPIVPIPGDLSGDGAVGVSDLLLLLAEWGNCADVDSCPADLNGDGTVGVADLLILLANWG